MWQVRQLVPYLRANTGTAAAGGDQASSTARTTQPAIQPTARGKRREVRIRGSGRWLGRICMVLSFVHQVRRQFSNRLRSTQDPCHQKGVGTREFRCTDASWRCEFVISTTRARRDGDITRSTPLSAFARVSGLARSACTTPTFGSNSTLAESRRDLLHPAPGPRARRCRVFRRRLRRSALSLRHGRLRNLGKHRAAGGPGPAPRRFRV